MDACQKELLSPEDGVAQYSQVHVAGVNCWPTHNTITQQPNVQCNIKSDSFAPTVGVLAALLVIAVLIIIRYIVYYNSYSTVSQVTVFLSIVLLHMS